MNNTFDFEDLRPFHDSEVPAAMRRMVNTHWFPMLSKIFFPDMDILECRERLLSIKTIDEFQNRVVMRVVDNIIADSMTSFTCKGIEEMGNEPKHVLVSNHRDIVLDPAVLNIAFLKKGIESSEITFGDNLIKSDFIADFCKVNKMVPILREGSARDFYNNSVKVSNYMRYVVTHKHQSIWIAQRNGRTKDGNDKTEVGVLKMFSLSGNSNFVESMDELKINPVAVSYEYDPCDFLKAAEMYVSTYQKYMKGKNEDMNSIMKGFMQQKGDVEFVVAKPITREELEYCDTFEKNEKFTHLADIIDERIYSNYKLFKTNYIAHDILHSSNRFADRYTADQKKDFEEYMHSGILALEFPHHEDIENIFLHIYANPVDNCLKFQQ